MPSRSWARRAGAALIILALAGSATVLVHRDTLSFGFDYDDYFFLRPYTAAEVAATFVGPWDTTGVMVKFYRPLTVAWHALRFDLFGLNAVAHHTVSLTLFALAAALTAALADRVTSRRTAAVAATLLFVAHPAMPYSLVAWVTNQMHLAHTLVVLAALLWWHIVRARGLAWWLPLFVFAAAAFMVKEDGIMLLPAIVAVHTIVRHVSEPRLPPISWRFLALAAIAGAALLMLRSTSLGELGGYGRPTAHGAYVNLTRGLNGVFRLVPADRPWQLAASWFATVVPLVALAGWRWVSPGARSLLLVGLTIAFLFNLPFALVTKAEQMYLIATGAVLTLTGGVLGVFDLLRRLRPATPFLWTATAALTAGLACFAAVARDIARDFAPFGPVVLAHDDIVRTWGPVASDVRDYVARKREPDAARHVSSNPVDEIAAVRFGVQGPETSPDGISYVWMTGAVAEIHVRATARSVAIPIRHAIDAFREPARARVEVDGRPADDLALTTTEWRVSTLPLRAADASRLSRMHRITITIDHAWQPSQVIPGSTDNRILGLQIGDVVVK